MEDLIERRLERSRTLPINQAKKEFGKNVDFKQFNQYQLGTQLREFYKEHDADNKGSKVVLVGDQLVHEKSNMGPGVN